MIRTQRRSGAPRAVRFLGLLGLLGVVAGLLSPTLASAQPGPRGARPGAPPPRPIPRTRPQAQLPSPSAASDEDPPSDEPPTVEIDPPRVIINNRSSGSSADFPGALQTLRAPAGSAPGGANRGPEIFPDASRVWMSVRDTDPIPLETARQGGPWLCANGQCTAQNGDPGQTAVGDGMLRSIKLQTPTLPLPLTIWGRLGESGRRVLDFDPVLLDRRSYGHICAYRPLPDPPSATDPAAPKAAPKKPEKVLVCHDGPAAMPTPNAGELTLGLEWPRQSELADFRYLAIVDSCGNARVQPFQRTFTVPVFEVATGGCGQADGKVLRVFPQGGWIRVTAFNLDAPATANVVNATYRVSIPPLENGVESSPARLLFPDPLLDDIKVDCGPTARQVRGDDGPPPGASMPGPTQTPPSPPPPKADAAKPDAPKGGPARGDGPEGEDLADKPDPGAKPPLPGDKAPPATAPPGKDAPAKAPPPLAPVAGPPPQMPKRAFDPEPKGPGAQALAHQSVVIAPEPLRQGNCRLRLTGQAKRRLVAPLALYVSFTRTDRTINGAPIEMLTDGKWIVTPSAAEFQLPALAENFDGDSRLRLVVSSDPLSANGKVVLLSDAGRVASSLRTVDGGEEERARRIIGSVVIHSVPLCGSSNFETVESVGSCIRAYITIPAMLATIQITRAPWVEKPLVTRSVLSAVGVALAIDSYNPVERRAFPIAGQVGGFIESLGDGRIGMLGYVGIAPTLPVLGSGGNTTSFGFLGGIGVEYITNDIGPDEGLKPAAFLGVVVQVGQANPSLSGSAKGSVSASGGF
jgi:hypothetical protein